MKVMIHNSGRAIIVRGFNTLAETLATALLKNGHDVYYFGISNYFISESGSANFHVVDSFQEGIDSGSEICITNALTNPTLSVPVDFHVYEDDLGGQYNQLLRDLDTPTTYFSVNSQYQKDQFPNQISDDKIRITSNMINEDLYKPEPSTPVIDKSIVVISNFSSLKKKTFDVMFDVMKNFQDYTFNIVGYYSKGNNAYRQYKKKFDKTIVDFVSQAPPHTPVLDADIFPLKQITHDITTNINFVGEKIGSEKIDYIRQHQIAIGTERASKETELCGVPTLVFGKGWGDWITEANHNNLVEDDYTTESYPNVNPNTLRDNIETAISGTWESMSRAEAVNHFGMDNGVTTYIDYFNEIISGSI